eukprot:189097_1
MFTMSEEKEANLCNDDCDCHDYQEVVVNGNDFRKEVHRIVSHRDMQIMKCIGQIESGFDYKIEHEYKQMAVGTGTVYQVTNEKIVFILTCAHNVRHLIKHCTICDTYNEKTECSKCKNNCDQKKIIKPTSVEFHRYTSTDTNFGHLEDTYECREIYIPDAYEKHTFGEKGFDFAILMFRDHKDKYYATNCLGINVAIGTDILAKYKRFSIFGYPAQSRKNAKYLWNKLYGYAMKSDVKNRGIEFIDCDKIYDRFRRQTECILRQRHVDASPGQSGSAVFVKTNDSECVIFGVHIGGHKKKVDDYAFNRVTLLGSNYIRIMEEATENIYRQKYVDVYQDIKKYIGTLGNWKLILYSTILIENGYDEWEDWRFLTVNDLESMGFKKGPATFFVRKIERILK